MRWKDFLYFRKGSKIGVILLLILILLALLLNVLLSYRDSSTVILMQNDSIVREFNEFLSTLKTIDASSQDSVADPEAKSVSSPRQSSSPPKPKERKQVASDITLPGTLLERDNRSSYPLYPKVEKLSEGEAISLNSADTAEWKKIPGIGTVYASRIVEYRNRLGGFARKEQLMEVYGVDNEMYMRISPYIEADDEWRMLEVNHLEFKELLSHPYLSYKQVQAIMNLRRRKGSIASIQELAMLDEFTKEDIYRLEPYLEF